MNARVIRILYFFRNDDILTSFVNYSLRNKIWKGSQWRMEKRKISKLLLIIKKDKKKKHEKGDQKVIIWLWKQEK